MRTYLILIAVSFAFSNPTAGFASASPNGGKIILPPDDLRAGLARILAVTEARGGMVAALVVRVRDGRCIYSKLPDLRLMPASNRKLFTSAVGLELLGGTWKPQSEILTTAQPDSGGVVDGDLILRGGGDATLSEDDLRAIAGQLAEAGIKRIGGNVVGDGSLFTDGPYGMGWGWDYLSDDYAAQISALEVNRGVVTVDIASGTHPGDPLLVTLTPAVPFMDIENTATTAASSGTPVAPAGADLQFVLPSDATAGPPFRTSSTGPDPPDSLKVERIWDRNVLNITGTLPAGRRAQIDITVADPARYAATVFESTLAAAGITVSGTAMTGKAPSDAISLLKHSGPPISTYIKLMNKPSDNLLAETLIRLVGFVKGKGGSYDEGHAVEIPFLHSSGIDTHSLDLEDGCGVSRRDYVTARAVTSLLVHMHSEPDWNVFYDSLPIAGVDGTLRRRMKGTSAEGNVHAKTGSLGEASCLSGYLTSRHGTLYAFSILMNNYSGPTNDMRAAQDIFVESLIKNL